MNRQVKKKDLPPAKGRIICISDIHGDLKSYDALLEKAGYQPGNDRLMILGDLMEKGDENLKLLRRVMNQFDKGEDIHMLMGNCDFTAFNVLYSYRLDYIHKVLLQRKQSLVHEMIAEAGLAPMDAGTDLSALFMELRKHYLKELSFLADLCHVLEDDRFVYTHAALCDPGDYSQDWRFYMTSPFFSRTDKVYSKPVICGHMPVSEYCRRFADFNPFFNASNNIWSIDGGNQVNTAGQLNALILEQDQISSIYVDRHPVIQAVFSKQISNPVPFYIPFNHSALKQIEEKNQQVLVHSDFLNRTFWMDRLFFLNGRDTGYTNYQLSYSKGDSLNLIHKCGSRWLAKKNGILGWVDGQDFIQNDKSEEL